MRLKAFLVETFNGGVRQDLPFEKMPDNALFLMENWEYRDDGTLATRGGSSVFNSTSTINGICDNGIRFYRETTGVKTMAVTAFVTGETVVYTANDTTGALTLVTGNTLTASLPVCFVPFRDYLWMANGTDTMQVWQSGTARTACVFSDNNRKGKYIAVADWRMFVAGDSSAPNRIYISSLGVFATSPGADCSFPTDNGYIDIPSENTGDKITGLASFQEQIYVFRTNDVWAILGDSPVSYSFQKVLDDCGAVDQRAVITTPEGMLFADNVRRTVWFFSPGKTILDVGGRHQYTLTNASFASAAGGFYAGRQLGYMSFKQASAATYNDYTLVFDYKTKQSWTNTIGASAFVDYSVAGDSGYFYALKPDSSGANKGLIYRLDTGTQDNSVSFTATLKTKYFNFGENFSLKMLRELWLMGYAETTTPFTITALADRDSRQVSLSQVNITGMNRWGELVYGVDYYGGGSLHQMAIPAQAASNFKEIQFVITKSDAYTLKIHSAAMQIGSRPVRRR